MKVWGGTYRPDLDAIRRTSDETHRRCAFGRKGPLHATAIDQYGETICDTCRKAVIMLREAAVTTETQLWEVLV